MHIDAHNSDKQFCCYMKKCTHKTMYASADDLTNKHWRVNCKGFILKCDKCKYDIKKGHNCIKIMLKKKQDLAGKISTLEQEV